MIKVKNNKASRDPVPAELRGLSVESLADLTWTDPSRGFHGVAWWPEVDQTPALTATQSYDGTETLTVGDGVVYVVRGIRELTAEELRGPIPSSCTPAQGLVALYAQKGITEDQLLQAIENIPDAVQKYTVRIGFQRAITWERYSQSTQVMAQLLQLTEEDLDNLFEFAVTVTV